MRFHGQMLIVRLVLPWLNLRDAKKPVVLLTGTMASPSTDKIVQEFTTAYPNVKHIVYDAISESGAADAFEAMYGERAFQTIT